MPQLAPTGPMSRRPRTSVRWLRAATAVLAVVAGTVVITAQPAHAIERMEFDTFESNATARWHKETPAKTVVAIGRHSAALAGENLAQMDVLPNTPVPTSQAPRGHLYRTVTIPSLNGPAFCMLEMYLSRWRGANGGMDVTIHDGGLNGPVLATDYYLTTRKQWTQWRMAGSFDWRSTLTLSIKLRVGFSNLEAPAASGTQALIDNVTIRCVGYPR